MKSVELKAFPRTATRRTALRGPRRQGRVPATVYGRKIQPQNLEVDGRDLQNLMLHSVSENLLVDLAVAEDARPKRLVLLQEVQHHPLSGKVLHIDLHEVAENEPVTITVPVETAGTPIGVSRDGGILEHVLFKVRVRALPRDLPEFLEVDVSELELGESVHIGEMKSPTGVVVLGDSKIPVVSVAAPRVEAVEATPGEAAAAVAAGPEVIKEKKPDEKAEKPGKPEKPVKPEKKEG